MAQNQPHTTTEHSIELELEAASQCLRAWTADVSLLQPALSALDAALRLARRPGWAETSGAADLLAVSAGLLAVVARCDVAGSLLSPFGSCYVLLPCSCRLF